jgi:hypothetical protein
MTTQGDVVPSFRSRRDASAAASSDEPLLARARRWLPTRFPELAIVLFGIALRISLGRWYHVQGGYDFAAHEEYLRYVQQHGAIPPYDMNFSAYNPALYYALGALMLKLGFSIQALGAISIVSSSIQVLLVWLGAELYLPKSRFARVLTLALSVVVPASVHVAGLVSNQGLNDVFCVGAILLMPQVFRRRGRAALACAAGAGACLGLALLTKVSGAAVFLAFVLAVGIAIVRARPGEDVARRLLPGAALFFAVVGVVCGWHYARHKLMYGKFVLVAYDPFTEIDDVFKIPYLDRRTLGFVGYWDDAIYRYPFWPSAVRPRPRFGPVLVATTFSDYYNFAFVPPPKPGVPSVTANGRPMRAAALPFACASVVAGTALALLSVIAGALALRRLWRRGDDGRLVLLFVPLCAVALQLHFAVRFSNDISGPIKASYLQFAAPVFCGLVALAIDALWKRRGLAARALAIAGMASIAVVAAYTIYARIIVPITS